MNEAIRKDLRDRTLRLMRSQRLQSGEEVWRELHAAVEFALAQERKPLTLEQCRQLVVQHFEHGEMNGDDVTLIRAVEKAHGVR